MSLFSRFFGNKPPKGGGDGDAQQGGENAPDGPPNPLAATVPQQSVQQGPHGAPPQGPAIPHVPTQAHSRTERMIPVDQRPPPPGQFPSQNAPPIRPQLESERGIPLSIPEPAVEMGSGPPPPSSVDPRFAHWGGRDPNAEVAETVPPVLRYGPDGASVAVAAPPDASDLTPTPARGTNPSSHTAIAVAPVAPSPAAPAVAPAVPPKAKESSPGTGKQKRKDSPTNFHQVKPPAPPAAPHPGLRPNDALPTIIVDIPASMPPPALGARDATPAPEPAAPAPIQRNTLKIPGAISTTPKPGAALPSPGTTQPLVHQNLPPQRMMSDTRPDPDSQAIMRAAVAYRESKAAVEAAAKPEEPKRSTQPLNPPTQPPTQTSTAPSPALSSSPQPQPQPQPHPQQQPQAQRSYMRQKAPTLLGGMAAPSPPAPPPPAPSAAPAPTAPSMQAAPRAPTVPPPPPPIASSRTPVFDEDDDVNTMSEPPGHRQEPKTEVNLQDFVPAALAQVAAAAQSMKARASVAPEPPDESDWPTASELPDPEEWSKPVATAPVSKIESSARPTLAEPPAPMTPMSPSPMSPTSNRAPRGPIDEVDDDDVPTTAHVSKRPAALDAPVSLAAPPVPSGLGPIASAMAPTVGVPPTEQSAEVHEPPVASEPMPMTTRSAHPAPPVEGAELEIVSSGPATVPPSAPPPAPHGPEPKLWDGVGMDDVFDELDRGFGELGGAQSNRPADSAVFDDARQLFTEIAATHMHHVRDFMLDLTAAPTTADWLALCIPATQSLRMGAVAFEMGTLTVALDAFMDALKATNDSGVPIVEGEHRDALIAAYGRLAKELPSAFKLDNEGRVREGIIVRALLNQLEDVRKVQQDRLFMAGLMSLDALCVAKPRDIVETTGLSLDLATRISERFRRYRLEMSILAHGNDRGEWEKLREYVDLLSQAHNAFEVASEKNDSKKKKESRRMRELTILDVKVMLARLGQPESLNFIERAPYAEKISHLVALIEHSER